MLEEKRQAYLSISQGEDCAIQRWRVRTIIRGWHIQEVYPHWGSFKNMPFPNAKWCLEFLDVLDGVPGCVLLQWDTPSNRLVIHKCLKYSWSWFAWALLIEEKDVVKKMSFVGMMFFFIHLTFFWAKVSMMSRICTSSGPPWWNVGSWFQCLSEEINHARRLDIGECKGLISRDKTPAYLELYLQRFHSQWQLVGSGGKS